MYIGRLLTPKQNLLGACFTLLHSPPPSLTMHCTCSHTHTYHIYSCRSDLNVPEGNVLNIMIAAPQQGQAPGNKKGGGGCCTIS